MSNLFSLFNFKGEITERGQSGADIRATVTFDLSDPESFRIRKFREKLIAEKPKKDRDKIVKRILAMDVDVLTVQEVEDIDTLNRSVREDLKGRYRYRVLIEGNDPLPIDVGVLSELPIGGVTSCVTPCIQMIPPSLSSDEICCRSRTSTKIEARSSSCRSTIISKATSCATT